jgi:hypothetical protein
LLFHFDKQQQATLITFRLVSLQAIKASNVSPDEKIILIRRIRCGGPVLDEGDGPSSRDLVAAMVRGENYKDGDGSLRKFMVEWEGTVMTV